MKWNYIQGIYMLFFVDFGLSFDSQRSITHIRRWFNKKKKKKADHTFTFQFYKSFSMTIFRYIIIHIYNIQDSHTFWLMNLFPFLHDFSSWSWLLDDYFFLNNFIETAFTGPLLWNMNKVLSKSKFHSYINTLIELNVRIDARMV